MTGLNSSDIFDLLFCTLFYWFYSLCGCLFRRTSSMTCLSIFSNSYNSISTVSHIPKELSVSAIRLLNGNWFNSSHLCKITFQAFFLDFPNPWQKNEHNRDCWTFYGVCLNACLGKVRLPQGRSATSGVGEMCSASFVSHLITLLFVWEQN